VYRCFDKLDDAVIILDRDNTVARLNRSFQEIFGIDDETVRSMETEEFTTSHLARFLPEGEGADRVIEALRYRQEVSHAACRIETPDGEVRWFSFSCRMMTEEPYTGMALVRLRDITSGYSEAAWNASEVEAEVGAETIRRDR